MTSNNAANVSIQLWVRSEPLTYGILQINPHPRLLSLYNIKKLVSYAKGKGKAGYPKLSYPIWKHIACNKLQISENLAWTSQKLRNIEARIFAGQNSNESEQVKASVSVDLFKFVLFLYLQQINKISLRANAASPNAEWPEARRSMDSDAWKSENKNMDEQQHLQFVLQNIGDILEILTDPATATGLTQDGSGINQSSTSSTTPLLSMLSMEALNLLIEGRIEKSGQIRSLTDILGAGVVSMSKLGYSKSSKTFEVRGFGWWVRTHLTSCPFGVEVCMSQSGKRLGWASSISRSSSSSSSVLGGDDASVTGAASSGKSGSVRKSQRIATTANLLPRSDTGIRGNKLVLLYGVCNQTIARSSSILDMATVKIHRCCFSYLYLLSPLRCVSVEKCRKSTLVLGPVESTVQLLHCEDCVVMCICRRLVLVGCRRMTLYIGCSTSPLLCQQHTGNSVAAGTSNSNNLIRASSDSVLATTVGVGTSSQTATTAASAAAAGSNSTPAAASSNEDICLAPFCSYYPTLNSHLARVYIDPSVNFWDYPTVLGGGNTVERCWELLPPVDFYPITVPFEMSQASQGVINTTSTCPVPWPSAYEEALRERSIRYDNLRSLIKNAKLNAEQSRIFRSVVEKRFRSWLTESDEYRQLILLDPASCPGGAMFGSSQVGAAGAGSSTATGANTNQILPGNV